MATIARAAVITLACLAVASPVAAQSWGSISSNLRKAASGIDTVSEERYAALREAERYQYEVALRYYKAGNWRVAMAECEKFLRLYERSELAPLVQLWWSHCQFHQQKANTAIREGYQSVIDYWPDAPEATNAAYYIARTYRDIGDVRKAEDRYRALIRDASDSYVAVIARSDLKDLAKQKGDNDRWLKMLTELAFDVEPKGPAADYVRSSAHELAGFRLARGELDAGKQAIERWLDVAGKPEEFVYRVYEMSLGPISSLTGNDERRAAGEKMAQEVIKLIEQHRPPADGETKGRAKGMTFWIADVHARARDGEAQLKTYEQMLKTFGQSDDILGQIAGWHRARQQFNEARRVYAKYEDQIEGQRQTASSWREENKFDEAIAIYTELVTADPDRASNYQYAVGDCYRDSGRLKEAISAYRVIDEFPGPQWRMAHCHRGLKQYEEARLLYGQIMTGSDSDTTAAQALYAIAETFESETKPEQAIIHFQRVCKLFPKTGHASNAHTRLQDKYGISITLGGVTEEK